MESPVEFFLEDYIFFGFDIKFLSKNRSFIYYDDIYTHTNDHPKSCKNVTCNSEEINIFLW